jgi:ubiquinone/menaquinone biosynthesis C-methylase UbiE
LSLAFDPEFLDLLLDPASGAPLELQDGILRNPADGRLFPIIAGIPSFVKAGVEPWRHRLWRGFYDRAAFAYDGVLALGSRLGLGAEAAIRRGFLSELAVPPRGWMLEVGAGTAANRAFLPKDARYVGLDISMGMLRRAQRRFQTEKLQGYLVHADGQDLPLKPGAFYLVLCMGVLQYLEAPRRAMQEMGRVAALGGVMLVLDERSSVRRLAKRMGVREQDPEKALRALAAALEPAGSRMQAAPLILGDYYGLRFNKEPE